MTHRLIISSNYPGLGKDTLLKNLEAELGCTSLHLRVGDILRVRASEIIEDLKNGLKLSLIADKYQINKNELQETLSAFTQEEIEANNPNIKTVGQRQLQQDLGKKFYPDDYWASLLEELIIENVSHPFIASAGVRLPLEVDMFKRNNFFHIRLKGEKELARKRIWERDQATISEDQLDHPVERALDNYENFDLVIDAHLSTGEITKKVLDAYLLINQ